MLQGCNFFAAKVVANRGLTDNFSYDGRFVAAGGVAAGSVPLWLVLQCPHQQTYLARYSYSVKAKKVGSTTLHVLHHASFMIAWHCTNSQLQRLPQEQYFPMPRSSRTRS